MNVNNNELDNRIESYYDLYDKYIIVPDKISECIKNTMYMKNYKNFNLIIKIKKL